MKTEKRWELIEELLRKCGTLSTQELAEKLSVSETTIRRDLIKMENANMVNRLWGGACLAPVESNVFSQYYENAVLRFERNLNTKQQLARYAASLISNGNSVFIDSGSTTFFIPQYITAQDITVVTNNVGIFQTLAERRIRAYVPHGMLNFACAAIMGADTAEWIGEKNFDLVFLGSGGTDPVAGYTTHDENDATVKRSAMSRCKSGSAYVLCDSSKFGTRCFHTFAALNDACLITDAQPPFPVEKMFIVN